MTKLLITLPENVSSAFIDHLTKLDISIAKQITIRVLSDSTTQRVIDSPYTNEEYNLLREDSTKIILTGIKPR